MRKRNSRYNTQLKMAAFSTWKEHKVRVAVSADRCLPNPIEVRDRLTHNGWKEHRIQKEASHRPCGSDFSNSCDSMPSLCSNSTTESDSSEEAQLVDARLEVFPRTITIQRESEELRLHRWEREHSERGRPHLWNQEFI